MGINLAKIFENIDQIVKDALSPKTLGNIGKTAVARIQKRTRIGKGVKQNLGKPHQLPKLAKQTKRERTRLKKEGLLTGPAATPGKSGLNRTGQMLGDMGYTVDGNKVHIELDPKGANKAETIIKNNPNFEFMNISNAEFKALVKVIEQSIEQSIKKLK